MTFLCIDDDAEDAQLFCEFVAEIDSSFQCIVCYTPKQAIKFLDNGLHPDIIFMDFNLGGQNAKEVLPDLVAREDLKGKRIIIWSTHMSDSDISDCNLLGAAMCVKKPSSIKELNKILDVALKRL